ncbi:MAG: peptidoglycan D,D-transpeptidase FtsI family protein [Actinomycetota bacterium]
MFIACGLLGACTQGDDFAPPQAAEPADAFVAAWDEGDAAAMVDLFDADSAPEWSERRLDRLLKTVVGGVVHSISVELNGDVTQPEVGSEEELEEGGLEATVPYTVSYGSEALEEPASLEGELEMTYDVDSERWGVVWSKDLLWPGIQGAAGFDVKSRWPARAAILDRNGRRLARGTGSSRSYPFGASAGTTIGHLEPVDRGTAAASDGTYQEGDLIGASGLELAYEERLAGVPTTRLLVVDRKGRALETLGTSQGSPGKPVKATIDIRVQQAAESAYGATTGGAVVMDPGTGDLLAIVSSSPFDPNGYVGVAGVEPFNRALSGLYPPGSSMKVVTGAAALDTGTVTATTTVTGPANYQGVTNFESGVYAAIPFSSAVKFSVNTAFAQVAEDLGGKKMTRYARAFGFNGDPTMALDASASSFPPPEDLSDLMWGSIGQAQVLATPLVMANVSATIANNGVRMEPRATFLDDKTGERAVSRKTARTMNQLMQGVVQGGTGVAAQSAGVPVAGKTGTAEVSIDGKIKNHAWFTAFAPASDPKVAVAVVSELGGIGGQVAAPLAGSILRNVLPYLR